jgi:hypothetical protein
VVFEFQTEALLRGLSTGINPHLVEVVMNGMRSVDFEMSPLETHMRSVRNLEEVAREVVRISKVEAPAADRFFAIVKPLVQQHPVRGRRRHAVNRPARVVPPH